MRGSVLKRYFKEKVLKLPHIKRKRKKYINYIRSCYDYSMETPTIICASCVGGMISHNLGLKFMSPTINLWLTSHELVKFVCNMDKYLNEDFEFINNPYYDYPVGKLDDICVYFQHYTKPEQAESKWNERKKRINRDNMFIIADDKDLSDDEINALMNVKCKRLVIFTAGKQRNENFFVYDCYKEKGEVGFYSVRDFKGFAPFEREFNYAAWLSGEKDYRLTWGKINGQC